MLWTHTRSRLPSLPKPALTIRPFDKYFREIYAGLLHNKQTMGTPIQNPKRLYKIVVVSLCYDKQGSGIGRSVRRLINELTPTNRFHFTWAASATDMDGAPTPSPSSHSACEALLPMKTNLFLEKIIGLSWPLWGFKSLGRL